MQIEKNKELIRVGVFYDGNYFFHVSNYYNYVHERHSRISISGLHDFIRNKIADVEYGPSGFPHCQIVDAHYFRSRPGAAEASQKGNLLYYDRVFDDILMSEGITTHYLPLKNNGGTQRFDKSIDVLLALEAFELAFHKSFDVIVLIASDSDYVPLARKLNSLGTRIMLLSWDFDYQDDFGNHRVTRTSQDLLKVVTYPVYMEEIINEPTPEETLLVEKLFVNKEISSKGNGSEVKGSYSEEDNEDFKVSTILSVKSGYGFIKYPPENLFFHYEAVVGCDFYDLEPGDQVRFRIVNNDKGEDVAMDVELAT
ncbi:NYN domain-containing protein [Marinilabilia rubra]|uniref:Cold-shock protein n=1 Tax=Marinilabilia rubra TaxID=2162893 RepID=A0A2U2BDW0_9BACT|nr:NYN domain-containing protein [Marinilabilia rubra]PWE01254.1 cold-shock protein [Marinilabilia rubra]